MKNAILVIILLSVCACSTAQQQNAGAQAVTDAYLTTAVTTKLAVTNADSVRWIHVSVRNAVVTLRGQAHSLKEETQYLATAKSVNGVHSVVNQITVNPHLTSLNQSASDAALTVKVSGAIAGQAGLNVFHVSPAVRNGVVTLNGTVPNRAVEQTIVQTTQHVSGVSRVVSNLRITP
ncbi:MAG TPA: BON domain-containing protein [Candidatus Rubrimentiphilum sp.]|nr:BON domain-containing protein [Candidatus Rubrimentiphilum sp.]